MPRSLCPVASSLDLVDDRWTLLVIRDLLFGAQTVAVLPYDQYLKRFPELESTTEPLLQHDSSTNALIRRYRARKHLAA